MNYTVYEGTQQVGELTIEASGLYYEIRCKLQGQGPVRRIYGIRGTDSICLGVPDKNGELLRRIPRKHLPVPERVIASTAEPGKWLPWCGDQFGTMLQDCFICFEGEVTSLALRREDWEKIPQWKNIGKRETVDGRAMIRVDLGADGQSPQIEKEIGGEENEVHTQNLSNDIDPLLLADLPADYDYGGTGTEEADRHHL